MSSASSAAQEWARKKKEREERAKVLREERKRAVGGGMTGGMGVGPGAQDTYSQQMGGGFGPGAPPGELDQLHDIYDRKHKMGGGGYSGGGGGNKGGRGTGMRMGMGGQIREPTDEELEALAADLPWNRKQGWSAHFFF